jgi:uncharacterized protein YbdZ (MbtH family)
MSWRDSDNEDTTIYKVVLNHEEQYSIWPEGRENPLGWNDAGKSGTKPECLAYIKELWTDMRPLSLRKLMEQEAQNPSAEASENTGGQYRNLVEYLSESHRPVAVTLRPNNDEAFRESLDRGYVFIKFTDTNGGTELGLRIDPSKTDLSRGDLDARTGTIHLEGELTLNQVGVRCFTDIDLSSLTGQGRLEQVATS